MASTPVAARLRYLDSASYLVFASSPSTSAFLQNEYRKTADGANLTESEERQQRVCSACGTILISGITSQEHKVRTTTKRRKRGNSPPSVLAEKTQYVECSRCNSRTNRKRDTPKSTQKLSKTDKRPTAVKGQGMSSPPSSSHKPTSSHRATRTKKRTRKANSLQALLARSKLETPATQSPGFGLDLKDLLKSN